MVSRMNDQSAETDLTPAEVDQFRTWTLIEHYSEDGYLLLITSDEAGVEMEPGDFLVKRTWATSVVPYVHRKTKPSTPTGQT